MKKWFDKSISVDFTLSCMSEYIFESSLTSVGITRCSPYLEFQPRPTARRSRKLCISPSVHSNSLNMGNSNWQKVRWYHTVKKFRGSLLQHFYPCQYQPPCFYLHINLFCMYETLWYLPWFECLCKICVEAGAITVETGSVLLDCWRSIKIIYPYKIWIYSRSRCCLTNSANLLSTNIRTILLTAKTVQIRR